MRGSIIAVTTALIVLSTFATVAQASPNDGRYKTSSEAFKKQLQADICVTIQGNLQGHEAQADQHAGTPEAAKYAKAADKDWKDGEAHGCSWAQ